MKPPVVYVACPLGDRTGGPEALTLLVHSFRQRGVEAYLIPMRNFRGRSPHPEYDHFDYALAEGISDPDRAHLVLTEVSPIESRRELEKLPDERIWMLWLSVNFSPLPRARYYDASKGGCNFFPSGRKDQVLPPLWPYDDRAITSGRWRTLRESARRKGGWSVGAWPAIAVEDVSIHYAEKVVRRSINYGTQSYYGKGFVRSQLNSDAFLLTDYPRRLDVNRRERERNLILYNGTKGGWKVGELQERLPDVRFQPIQGMTYREVCQALADASLYVEIGHLPGRDRLPREAALQGTPTVMLARGAGFCWEDFPIGERYRIPYTTTWADNMVPVIREVLADPSRASQEQEPFQAWVRAEPERYDAAVDEWVERLA